MPYIKASEVDTPAKLAELCEEAKLGLLEVLNAELIPVDVTPGEKIPVLRNRRIADYPSDKMAAPLRSKRHIEGTGDNAVEKVHAFTAGYGGIDEDIEIEVGHGPPSGGFKQYRIRFLIDSYYENEIGTNADNPEKRHAAEVARVAYAIAASRVLRRPGVVERIGKFRERRGFVRMGEAVIRDSVGEVFVVTCPVRIVKPA